MNLFEKKNAYQSGSLNKADYISEMYKSHKSLFDYAEYIRETDIARIEIADGKVILTSRSAGVKINIDKLDERLAPIEILNFGGYEDSELSVMRQLIEDDFNIFDVGANIGWYSLNLAKTFPKSHLFSFEPIPHTFNNLQTNIDLNQLENISVYNFGFSDQEGAASFYFYPEGSGNASLMDLSGRKSVQKIPCVLHRMDNFVGELNKRVDFIKCDTEGSELLVFKGGINTLNRYKPMVFTELLRKWAAQFNYHPNQVVDIFRDLGYLCFVVNDQHLVKFDCMNDSTVETNFFFLHEQNHSEKIRKLTRVD